MKRTCIIISAILIVSTGLFAQNADDALRYSQIFYQGTARYRAMGGAFTALGGDLSSISLNPAGTGVFRSSEFSFTPQLFYNYKSSSWNSTTASAFKYTFNLSQIGIVSNIISNGNDKGLVSLNLAYSFNRTNDFNEDLILSGISNNSSMADYWVNESNGLTKLQIPNDAWAANQTGLIDTITGSNTLYGTIFSFYGDNASSTYGQKIRREITNIGFTGEHAFSIGVNYSNKYFFGATIGINTLKYTGHLEHLENDVDNVVFDFKNFTYTDHLEATGIGYSLNLGTIIKPVEFLRIGLALHSPTVYRISETYFDDITSAFDKKINNVDTYEYSNNPTPYKYTLTTPFRANAGVAFQIRKIAMISADYEFVDYRLAQFSKAIDNLSYSAENSNIRDTYKAASNLRLGAEVRLSNIYLRGGYSYYGKVYKPNEDNKDLVYNSVSLGIGMRQQNFYVDLASSAQYSTSNYFMYYDPPYLAPSIIKSAKIAFSATMGFKF